MRVVNKGCKIDMHIHSAASCWKDKGIQNLSEWNLNNYGILIDRLKENDVNLFSITDHDNFDYELYSKLKEETSSENNLHVLPGVEFTITIDDVNSLHVVTVFDDKQDEKLRDIQEQIFDVNEKTAKYDVENVGFSLAKFAQILAEIDLDVVTIAHQKNSLKSRKTRKNDLNNAGNDVYVKSIKNGYFDAVEFRNPRNEIFQRLFHTENDLEHTIITGSDCHDWSIYPCEKIGSKANEFTYTHIKSLPTFKGLKLAVTEESRISQVDNFFHAGNYVKNLEFKNGENIQKIPLSKGINVIIGGNSSGKSALLHKMTNYSAVKSTKNFKKIYEKFLKERHITEFRTIDLQHRFEYQGAIRSHFEDAEFDIFEDLGIPVQDISSLKEDVENILDDKFNLFKKLLIEEKNLHDISNKNLELKCYKSPYNLMLKELSDFKNEDYRQTKKITANLIKYLEELLHTKIIKENTLYSSSIPKLILFIKRIDNELESKINTEKLNLQIHTSLKEAISEETNRLNTRSTSQDSQINKYNADMTAFENSIQDKFQKSWNIQKIQCCIKNIKNIEFTEAKIAYTGYNVYQKFNVEANNSNDIYDKIMSRIFNKDCVVENINAPELAKYVKTVNIENSTFEEALDVLNKNFEKEKNNFLILERIIEDHSGEKHSQGMNSKIFFDLLKNQTKHELVIIDQPEDDISQEAISNSVLKNIKQLSKYKQMIIVTHNPQFIINLDCDNVIFLRADKNSLEFKYGALEYEDSETNIIKIVSDNIEGGTDVLRKRLKRYDKN